MIEISLLAGRLLGIACAVVLGGLVGAFALKCLSLLDRCLNYLAEISFHLNNIDASLVDLRRQLRFGDEFGDRPPLHAIYEALQNKK